MQVNSIFKKELRKQGISQRQLAKLLNMDASSISRKLNGSRPIYIDEFAAICALLELSADEVLEAVNADIFHES